MTKGGTSLLNMYKENEKKGKFLKLYYKDEGYKADILCGYGLWLINNKAIKFLKDIVGEKRLLKQVEFIPVKLLSYEYTLKDKEINVKLYKNEIIKGLIEDYNIIHTYNLFLKGQFRRLDKAMYKEINFAFILEERRIVFSERVKEAINNLDIFPYKILFVTER